MFTEAEKELLLDILVNYQETCEELNEEEDNAYSYDLKLTKQMLKKLKEGWRMRKLKLELLDSGAKAIIIIALVWLFAFVLLMLLLVI